MAHEIQSRLDNGLGLTAERNLVLERTGVAGDRRFIGGARTVATITSAQLLALNATPITVIAAQGAGIAVIVNRVVVHKPAGTAYAAVAAGEDLVLKQTDASGAQVCGAIETTGLLDSTSATAAVAFGPGATGSTVGSYLLVANTPIVAHLLVGEVTTGDSPLYLEILYDLVRVAFTS
jgi:hypothetical protein